MQQIEEMEQNEKAVQADPCLTQIDGRVGSGNEKVGEKRRFRDECGAGGEGTGQGLRGEGGGAGGEKLQNKRKKEAKHEHGRFQGKGKEEAVEKRSVPHPRKTTRPKSSSMKKEWEVEGQAEKLRRESTQSARTTAKKPMLAMRGIKHV
jgi:hypothetical protein